MYDGSDMYWLAGLITTLESSPLAVAAELAILTDRGLTGLGQFVVMFIIGVFWLAWNVMAWGWGYFE